MIRRYDEQLVELEGGGSKYVATIYCNSTDNKPTTDLVNGSKLIEVDTGKQYLFNEATSAWVEI